MTQQLQKLLFDISEQEEEVVRDIPAARSHTADGKRSLATPPPVEIDDENFSPEAAERSSGLKDNKYHTATTEYTQLDVDDSEATMPYRQSQHRPLLLPDDEDDDDTDSMNNQEESKFYRLPSDGGSIFTSFLNMANSIIGAGIIGIPYSIKEAGFGMGILLLMILTVVVDWTIRLLIFNGKLAGRSTYQDLLQFTFGRPGLIAISIFQFVFAFGGMCAYCVIIGDTIPHVIRSLFPSIETTPILWIFANRNLCIAFFTLFVSYPLSLYRDISKLAKTSALALVAIVFITVSVAVEGPKVQSELRGSTEHRFDFMQDEIFQGIAVISFAYVCHHNSFLIFGSLKQPSLNRFASVTHWSMGIAFLTCIILGLSGYLVFTDQTAGNILNNFPSDNVFINIARLAFGLNMFTTIPLETFVCREVLETFFWPSKAFNLKRHFILTSILTLVALIISLLTCNLGIVLELTGAFAATSLAYVLPPLCYLKLANGSLWHYSKIPHWSCLIFGLIIMFVSSFYSIQKLFNQSPSPSCAL
ncbi:transmembrane amino acid transporter protein-domain-containing protein [Chlamydoabsidia padenii]|nr:transmembrane amino acid transporter protein-domain-containing protein [Chlamydoabsidia padenii]